ncbi:MAG: hypothetical protein ACIPMY_02390 [Rickettsia endosymbiont of Pentastiridius leporinus]
MKNLFYFVIVFFCLNSYSKPMPLGLELSKTTALDLIKKYKITLKETNYWRGYNYFIDVNDIKAESVSKALVICNDFSVVEAVMLSIDKNKFEELYNILKNKYSLVENAENNQGTKTATFTDNDCLVILESYELEPRLELVYITNNFYKDFLNKFEKEEKLKQSQIKELL